MDGRHPVIHGACYKTAPTSFFSGATPSAPLAVPHRTAGPSASKPKGMLALKLNKHSLITFNRLRDGFSKSRLKCTPCVGLDFKKFFCCIKYADRDIYEIASNYMLNRLSSLAKKQAEFIPFTTLLLPPFKQTEIASTKLE